MAATPRHVVILHGWSDTSRSFGALANFLRRNGHSPVPIWLGDYVSMDDDVRIEDVAERVEAVVAARLADKTLARPFDMVVHSTGGLVSREWVSRFYATRDCPLKRLVMLAPANFGSRLAAMGQSLLGRVVKGWGNWFHTGKEMLRSLELASPTQWRLARSDLFAPPGAARAAAVYGRESVWPFVITGAHPYTSLLRRVVNEDGADGTVRAAAANLNARGATVSFAEDEDRATFREWAPRQAGPAGEFPFAMLPARTHGSVISPDERDVETGGGYADPLGALLLRALSCPDFGAYGRLAADWSALTRETVALAPESAAERREALLPDDDPEESAEFFHEYLQLNVHVVDDQGADVPDYFLEFYGPETGSDDPSVYFHREVLEHVHANGTNPSYRCLYVDRTDLIGGYYPRIRKAEDRALRMSLSASPPGENVSYFGNYKTGARGHVTLHAAGDAEAWLQPNATHFLEVVIPRTPAEGVFRMRRGAP
ncbi:MAG: hypothetical protein L0216_04615 [Planctomycetales bacterium]|nr:hypothetical protein [Planctomycetales bacterium]